MCDIDKYISILENCKCLPERDFIKLCEQVRNILINEDNILSITGNVSVCGDVHAQFYDVRKLFSLGGHPSQTKYLFLGDYVDRGYYSLETISLLFSYKCRWPDNIHLIRGNHETRFVSKVYGLYDECIEKYGTSFSWKKCNSVFDLLAIGAIINSKIFCVHGGLSPVLDTIEEIDMLHRNREISQDSTGLSDLMWSDPDEHTDKWSLNPRGVGWIFGETHVNKFIYDNNIDCIYRAHQLVDIGYQYLFNRKILTIWSAPNYCYRCGNKASIVRVNGNISYFNSLENDNILVFDAVDNKDRIIPKTTNCYFL